MYPLLLELRWDQDLPQRTYIELSSCTTISNHNPTEWVGSLHRSGGRASISPATAYLDNKNTSQEAEDPDKAQREKNLRTLYARDPANAVWFVDKPTPCHPTQRYLGISTLINVFVML
jgi:hypothetical protein